MIVMIMSPLVLLLLFILVFISFTDLQEQIKLHDRMVTEGAAATAELYKKEDKDDPYGTWLRIVDGDELVTSFTVAAEILPDDFYNTLEVGKFYNVIYYGSDAMFPEFMDDYRYYIPDFRTKLIVVIVCFFFISINPRLLVLGFDPEGKEKR